MERFVFIDFIIVAFGKRNAGSPIDAAVLAAPPYLFLRSKAFGSFRVHAMEVASKF
jgi:hypothetical protein